MTFIKKLFKKKTKVLLSESDIFAYMGSIGISSESMNKYSKSINELKKLSK